MANIKIPALIVGIILLCVAALVFLGRDKFPVAEPSVATTSAQSAVSAGSRGQGIPTNKISEAAALSAKHAALVELSGNDKERWTRVLKNYFSQLDIATIWDVLNSPQIDQQNESKALRESIINSCIVQMREIEVKGSTQSNKPSLLTEACAALHNKADSTIFGKQSKQLQSDEAYQTAEFRLLGFDPQKLDPAKTQAELELARKALNQTMDPWLAEAGVHALWSLHSEDLLPDWSEISTLSRFQNNRLERVIAIDVACAQIGSCGPDNPWTLNFCALMPGTQCPPGSSFNDVVTLNLSQVELGLRQRILANLAQHYPH